MKDTIKRPWIVPLKGLNEVYNLGDGIVFTYI